MIFGVVLAAYGAQVSAEASNQYVVVIDDSGSRAGDSRMINILTLLAFLDSRYGALEHHARLILAL